LLGLTLIIVGFILRFGESIYGPMLEVGMAKLQLALSDTSMANFDVGSIQLGEYALVICIFVLAEALTIGILYGKPDVFFR
ncbi:hypothetical protein MAR_020379, partial [Mya arenaria]